MSFTGFELLPYHIILFISFALMIYGYNKKSILITNLAAIMLVLCGIYGVTNGFPTVTGYSEIVSVDNTTTISKVVGFDRNYVTDICSAIIALIGTMILIFVNIDVYEESQRGN